MKPKKGDKIIDIKGVAYVVGSSDVYFIKYLVSAGKNTWKED
jgi:hypothetical protein